MTYMQTPDVLAGREAVAAEIRALLGRRRIRQSQLARGVGMSTTALSRRLAGVHPFDIDELQRIASYLGVPVTALVEDVKLTPGDASHGALTARYWPVHALIAA